MDPRDLELRYQRTDVAEFYDRARFRGLCGRYSDWRLRRILTAIVSTLPPSALALDVPCGTGRIIAALTKASLRVIAADVSSAMLTVARRKTSRTSFLRTDALRLPFRSASVDVVFSIRFLHLLDPEGRIQVLNELARVARSCVVVEYRSVTKPLRVARRAALRWLGFRNVRKPTTVADVTDELRRGGLLVERCYFTSRWFSASVLIVARPTPQDDRADARVDVSRTVPSLAVASEARE